MRHKALKVLRILNDLRAQNCLNMITLTVESDSGARLQQFHVRPTYIDSDFGGYYNVAIVPNQQEQLEFVHPVMEFSINDAGGMIVKDQYEIEGVKFPQEDWINRILNFWPKYSSDLEEKPISVMEIAPIPPGANPYRHDHSRMGAPISKHWEIMYMSAGEGEIDRVIFIHTKSGRRFDLDLYEAEKMLPNNPAA